MTTDTLDFPTITDIPVTRTEIAAAANAAVVDIEKVDLTKLALAKFGPWREQTKTAKAEFAALVLDLGTQKAIDDAVSLRNRKIKQPLADARKTTEALKSKLATVSKAVGAELPLIEAGWADVASAITPRIEAAQQAIDDAKAEVARLEAERLASLRAKVDECMAGWLARCNVEGITAERVEAGIGMLGQMAMPVDSGLEDLADHWASAKLDTMGKMENIRLGLARAELTLREAAARAEAARVTGITRRITEIHAAATGHEKATAWELFEAIVAVEALDVGEGAYQEFAAAAQAAQASTLTALRAKRAAAVAREDEQAKAAQREQDAAAESARIAAAVIPERQASQQVLKAEPAMADATDSAAPANTSPVVGPTGVGQAADAAPVAERATISLGQIKEWLRMPSGITREFVESLGVQPTIDGRSILFTPSQRRYLKGALIKMLEELPA